MKKLFLFAVATALLASCAPTLYVQKVDVKGENIQETTGGYEYKDNNVAIRYNLWAKNGDPGFTIENLTDQIIYVDLTKSFYVSGGFAKDYYLNRAYSSSNSFAQTATSAVTASVVGRWLLTGAPGSKSATIASGAAKSSSNGVTYEEKPVIAIPPHTMKSVSEYNIFSTPFENCDMKLFPGAKDVNKYNFPNDESPRFGNVIVYRVGDSTSETTVENNFRITGYSNSLYTNATKTVKNGCKKTLREEYFTNYSPQSFYILYDNTHRNDYSSDAKVYK